MQNVSVTVPSGIVSGETISEDHFGTNFVFAWDRVDGTFDDRADQIGTTMIRFPGGTVTEQYFDPANPNATKGSFTADDGRVFTKNIEPLDEFLDYLAENEFSGLFVVPTFRYLPKDGSLPDAGEPLLSEADAEGLRGYIRQVMESGVEVTGFELGNEFMIWPDMTPEEYGRVASELAVLVREEIDLFEALGNLPADYERPAISLQATSYSQSADVNGDGVATANELSASMIEQLSPEAVDAIDAITAHRYISGSYEGIDGFDVPWEHLHAYSDIMGKDLDIILSEWNVSSKQRGIKDWDSATEAERDIIDTGLKQAGAMAAYFHELAANGVDIATSWGLQQQSQTSFAQREGTGTELKAGGEMMRVLAENTIGMTPILLSRPDALLDMHAFTDSEGKFIVLNSRSDEALSVDLDLDALIGNGAATQVQIMGVAAGEDPRDPDAQTVFRDVDPLSALESGQLTLDLNPYEIVLLSVDAHSETPPLESSTSTESENDGADWVIGAEVAETLDLGAGDDFANGKGGADRLLLGEGADTGRGGWGNDTLEGGLGNDRLFGDTGRDALFGGEGADSLDGGFGGDVLFGEDGDDYLFGGAQNDILDGGNGADTLDGSVGFDIINGGAGDDFLNGGGNYDKFTGGEGADVFSFKDGDQAWREQVYDFTQGEDKIQLEITGVEGFEDLFLSAEDSAVVINYKLGSIYLHETELEEVEASDFVFA